MLKPWFEDNHGVHDVARDAPELAFRSQDYIQLRDVGKNDEGGARGHDGASHLRTPHTLLFPTDTRSDAIDRGARAHKDIYRDVRELRVVIGENLQCIEGQSDKRRSGADKCNRCET